MGRLKRAAEDQIDAVLMTFIEKRLGRLAGKAHKERDIDPQILGRLTSALKTLGNADQAIEALRLQVKKNPSNAKALNDLGMLLESRGDFYGATYCYVDALRTRPDFPEAEFNLVCVRQRLFGSTL
jgi:Flp pilus assembly protein TadD